MVEASAENFAMPGMSVEQLQATAQVDALAGLRGLTVNATLTNAQAGTTRVETASLNAQARAESPEIIDFTLNGKGRQSLVPFELSSEGAYSSDANQNWILALETLQARYNDVPVILQRPGTVKQTAKGYESELNFSVGEGGLQLSAKTSDGQQDIAVNAERLPVTPFLPETYPLPTLLLAGQGRLTYPTDTKDKAQLEFTSDLFTEDESGLSPVTEADILWSNEADSGQLNVSVQSNLEKSDFDLMANIPARLQMEPFSVTVDKQAPLEAGSTIAFSLAQLNPYLRQTGTQIDGQLENDLRLSGNLAAPRIEGSIQLTDANVSQLEYGLCLRDVDITGAFEGDRVRFTQFNATGQEGMGKLSGTGEVIFFNEPVADISLTMEKLQMFCRPPLNGEIAGTLSFSGPFDQAALTGDLRLGPLAVTLPSGGAQDIPSVETIRKRQLLAQESQSEAEEEPATAIDLAIDVTAEERVFVRGRGLDAEFRGDLTIKGTSSKPIITGKLNTQRGFFDLLDKRLDIERGIISFQGTSPPSPFMDIEAVTDVKEITITVNLEGPVSDPELILSSNPELPQDELLARLLFGQKLSDLSPFQALSLAQSAAALAGKSSGPGLLGQARQALGVDALSITEDESGGTAVGAGKYINERVFIGVEQGATPESRKVTTEVEITPNISAETSTDAQGRTGANVQYRLDY
jgi:translocation and assembly module TamB